jgi:hypothetical protein
MIVSNGDLTAGDGTLYAVLMLDRLHEAQPFVRAFDAGAEGRYRAVLAERLKGTEWLGIEIWLPVLDRLRLVRRPDGRLSCTDIRLLAAAGLPALDLVIFDHVLDALDEDETRTLLGAHLARSALVLVLMPAAWTGGRWLPALRTTLIHGEVGVHFLSADAGRGRHLARLQERVPPLVQRTLPGDAIRWSFGQTP